MYNLVKHDRYHRSSSLTRQHLYHVGLGIVAAQRHGGPPGTNQADHRGHFKSLKVGGKLLCKFYNNEHRATCFSQQNNIPIENPKPTQIIKNDVFFLVRNQVFL